MSNDTTGSAFPYVLGPEDYANGLSKRELFAAMAMQALLSNSEHNNWQAMVNVQSLTETSVKISDALLKQLEL